MMLENLGFTIVFFFNSILFHFKVLKFFEVIYSIKINMYNKSSLAGVNVYIVLFTFATLAGCLIL